MISSLAFSLAAAACAITAPATSTLPDSTYRQLYESGQTFQDFLARAERRREQWRGNYESAVVPDALLTRAGNAGGPWRFLVIAVDGCSDSVNSVPYLARLVEKVPGLDLRIVNSTVGRSVMEAHRTPDGRAATPTIILLDETFAERGCWIERPSELQTWIIEQRGKLGDGEIFDRKMQWYEEEKGSKTLEEIVVMIEAAHTGGVSCDSKREG